MNATFERRDLLNRNGIKRLAFAIASIDDKNYIELQQYAMSDRYLIEIVHDGFVKHRVRGGVQDVITFLSSHDIDHNLTIIREEYETANFLGLTITGIADFITIENE
jgi:hypothetical protein